MNQTNIQPNNNSLAPWQLAALLGFALAVFYGTIVKDWGFADDDYGAIYEPTVTKKFTDLKSYFAERHNDQTVWPTNRLESYQPSFTNITFRPLTLVWYWLVSKMLDPYKPFHYYLLSIFLHILATLLLFAAFTNYLSPPLAFWAALLFGIFPFNGKFLGRLVIQPYSLCLMLNLVGYFWARAYFTRRHLVNLIASASCFFISILMHEASYSYLLLYGVILGERRLQTYPWKTATLWTILDLLPFVTLLGLCIFLKHAAYPDATSSSLLLFDKLFSLLAKLKLRFYDFVTIVVDMLGYNPIASGHRLLKSLLILIDAMLLLSLLRRSGNVSILILLGLCVSQTWISLLFIHFPRYLYFSLPYFILAWFIMYDRQQSSPTRSQVLQKLLSCKFFAILMLGLISVKADLSYASKKIRFSDKAICEFAEKLKGLPAKTNLLFAGLPFYYFPSGLAQGIWFYAKDNTRKIFYDDWCIIGTWPIITKVKSCEILYDEQTQILQIITTYNTPDLSLFTNKLGKALPCSIGRVIDVSVKNETLGQLDCCIATIKIKLFEDLLPCKFVTWDNKQGHFKFLKY